MFTRQTTTLPGNTADSLPHSATAVMTNLRRGSPERPPISKGALAGGSGDNVSGEAPRPSWRVRREGQGDELPVTARSAAGLVDLLDVDADGVVLETGGRVDRGHRQRHGADDLQEADGERAVGGHRLVEQLRQAAAGGHSGRG